MFLLCGIRLATYHLRSIFSLSNIFSNRNDRWVPRSKRSYWLQCIRPNCYAPNWYVCPNWYAFLGHFFYPPNWYAFLEIFLYPLFVPNFFWAVVFYSILIYFFYRFFDFSRFWSFLISCYRFIFIFWIAFNIF